MFDLNVLYASLIWGMIGAALLGYGKKQGRAAPIVGGLGLISLTFFIYSPISLSLAAVAILAAAYAAMRYGY